MCVFICACKYSYRERVVPLLLSFLLPSLGVAAFIGRVYSILFYYLGVRIRKDCGGVACGVDAE